MIIVKAPLRLPLGGGGTDLPAYCSKHGGHLITASINKYIYITINRPVTSDEIKLFYSQIEIVKDINDIKHNIIRECLRYFNIKYPIEINSSADISASTGMGSSSAFTVALLMGLSRLKGVTKSLLEIAELACQIEIDILKSPIGKQDQYASALGGINELHIDKEGGVIVNPLDVDIHELENRLLIFYTGQTRDANVILSEQNKRIEIDSTFLMHEIKRLGIEIKKSLIEGDIDYFGYLLNKHWVLKKQFSTKMSSSDIDVYYSHAMGNGAIGGKIMGAGGGGFLLLCSKESKRKILKEAMLSLGLKYMDFRFEFEGAKIIW